MAVITFIPDSNRIVHETKVDFSQRLVMRPIHIVQYDIKIPIISVSLNLIGYPYIIPYEMGARVRWGKPDGTFIYKEVLGCNQNRDVVYFEIDENMSYLKGKLYPIIELYVIGSTPLQKIGSSPILIEIDRNPIQETDVESNIEFIVDAILNDYIKSITLMSITTAPGTANSEGKYYDSTTKTIWEIFGGIWVDSESPPKSGVVYPFDGAVYVWDNFNLILLNESTDMSLYVKGIIYDDILLPIDSNKLITIPKEPPVLGGRVFYSETEPVNAPEQSLWLKPME